MKLICLVLILHSTQYERSIIMAAGLEDGDMNEYIGRGLNVFKPKKSNKIQGQQQCIDVPDWRQSSSNCFRPHAGPGCDNKACEAIICACDPSCCKEGKDWTAECAGVNEKLSCGARCDCLCSHQKN